MGYTLILATRPSSDPKEMYYTDLRQMSGSQIPKRIRQKGTNTLSGTWDGTGWISQMPPQENDRGSQTNVLISNTKEDKAKEDKYIVSPKCQQKMSKIFQ